MRVKSKMNWARSNTCLGDYSGMESGYLVLMHWRYKLIFSELIDA